MGSAEALDIQHCYEYADTPKEISETSGHPQATPSRTENATIENSDRRREAANSDKECGNKERMVEQVSEGTNTEGGGDAWVENSQAANNCILDVQTRSLDEAHGQIQVLLAPGVSAYGQCEYARSVEDVDEAMQYWGVAIALAQGPHTKSWSLLSTLGVLHTARFERQGELSDLTKAIQLQESAVSLIPNDHPDKPATLNNLGISYATRFQRLGELTDLSKAVRYHKGAVSLTPNSHPEMPVRLNDLGVSYTTQFEHLGKLSSLSKAIESQEAAVALTPDGHPGKLIMLNNLGVSYTTRFERLGEVPDLNNAIRLQEEAVSHIPNDHPEQAAVLSNLGNSYAIRFERLGELSDLDKAIRSQDKAVSLIPDGHQGKPKTLNNLGNSYTIRFEHLGELSDLRNAIRSQEEAVSLAADGCPNKLGMLGSLGKSYMIRFDRLGELSDLNKAIRLQEKVVSHMPNGHPKQLMTLSGLGDSYVTRFERLGELSDLHKAIRSQEEASLLAPDDLPNRLEMLGGLGKCYMVRFDRLGELSDLNKAIELQEEIVSLTPDPHPHKPTALSNLAVSYRTRFERLGELPDLSISIELAENAASLTPTAHSDRLATLTNLGNSYMIRFKRLGELSDLSKAISSQEEANSLTIDGHPERPKTLCNLRNLYTTRFNHLGELSDLSKDIKSQEEAVAIIPDGYSYKPGALSNLGVSYKTRFERLGKLADLSNAIKCQEQSISLTPDGHRDKSRYFFNLGISYTNRYRDLSDISDLKSAGALFKIASQSPTGPPSVRFHACRRWAELSLFDSRSSPFPAYQKAMSLIPQLVWIGTTIGRRYELTTEVSSFVTEAASYAISIGEFDIALEWLEAGRSIVWGQIAQLRTPFERLSAQNSKLAEDLASVGRQLEHAGSRTTPPLAPDSSVPELRKEVSTHTHLALKWDRLLKEIRSMPGFENFLRSPPAGQLLGAARAHPIVILSLHNSRCDALILKPSIKMIFHIALPNFSSKDALAARSLVFSQARDRKLGQRLIPPGPHQSSLEKLWSCMVKPVLDSLGYIRKLPVGELPHITWCATGLLSFLPLHTARSRDESQPGAFDLVISSYAPTLSVLLSTQSADPGSGCGILAVGQENTPGLANLPCTTKELAVIHKHAGSDYYLQLENDEATVEQVLDAMDQFSWVHMACHGSQNPYDPTKSAFHLHDGNLTLANITKRAFTSKGLAFLSACQTATGDENMPDEAVHLAAGMLMAGYPSVIGTMWSIADEDGPEVADLVYAELLKDGKMDYTNAARALHRAVAQLRDKVGEGCIERWAPFIHIGI